MIFRAVSANKIPHDLSLARFLRDRLHLTGTKISCGQGGCGACTVAIARGEGTDNQVTKSVNAVSFA